MHELEQAERVLIVVAHPDDEVIGAGAMLKHLRHVTIVHTTDGSPRDPADALRAGFGNREEYAQGRRAELFCAMSLANIDPNQCFCLGFIDQETMLHFEELCRRLEEQVSIVNPDVILTQPYEGGHPDHDATAFAVRRCAAESTPVWEMTSYHSRGGLLEAGAFLPNGEPAFTKHMTSEEIIRKQRMLACYQSQATVLQDFPVAPEQFRRAPNYDFSQPPHAGTLHYERLPWGITGARWRELAMQCR